MHRNHLLAITLTLAALLTACNLTAGPSSTATPGPTATNPTATNPTTTNPTTTDPATANPTATDPTATDPTATDPTTTATTPPARHILYLVQHDLWVALPDGSNARPLTTGSLGAGYAGAVAHDGRVDVYYTSLLDGDGSGGTFAVLRQPLAGGDPELLFTFRGGDKHVEIMTRNASVSPDGRFVAYADERGLNRRDLQTGEDLPLLANIPCDAAAGTRCHGYFVPSFAPAGHTLVATKIFFEGSTGVLVDTTTKPATERELRLDISAWSPDGSRLCALALTGLNYTGLIVLSAGLTSAANLTPNVPGEINVSGCAWSAAGDLAFTYTRQPASAHPEKHIITFDAALNPTGDHIVDVPGYINVFAWTPDTTEPIVSDRLPDDRFAYRNRILHPDGAYTDFPIAGTILGISPPSPVAPAPPPTPPAPPSPTPPPAPAPTPDAGRIVFIGPDGNVWTADGLGQDRRALTDTGNNRSPRWSPDGARIAYVHSTGAPTDPASKDAIYTIDATGAGQALILDSLPGCCGPVSNHATITNLRWSGDGCTLYAGVAPGPVGMHPIRSIPMCGPGVPESHGFAHAFDVRADGRFATTYYANGTATYWLAIGAPDNLDSGMNVPTPQRGPGGVAWSPDGATIAYESPTDGAVLFFDENGAPVGSTQPGAQYTDGWFVSWSPDGSEVLTDARGEMIASAADASGRIRDLGPGTEPHWIAP